MSITPGPWDTIFRNGKCYEVGSYDQTVAIVCSRNEADVRAIAVVPDMLALIPELAAYVSNELTRLKDLGPGFEKEREAARATQEKANALLARVNEQK